MVIRTIISYWLNMDLYNKIINLVSFICHWIIQKYSKSLMLILTGKWNCLRKINSWSLKMLLESNPMAKLIILILICLKLYSLNSHLLKNSFMIPKVSIILT